MRWMLMENRMEWNEWMIKCFCRLSGFVWHLAQPRQFKSSISFSRIIKIAVALRVHHFGFGFFFSFYPLLSFQSTKHFHSLNAFHLLQALLLIRHYVDGCVRWWVFIFHVICLDSDRMSLINWHLIIWLLVEWLMVDGDLICLRVPFEYGVVFWYVRNHWVQSNKLCYHFLYYRFDSVENRESDSMNVKHMRDWNNNTFSNSNVVVDI